MINNCYITVDNDETIYLTRNKVGYYSINDIKEDKLKNVQKEVLLKSIQWLVKLEAIPSKIEGLTNCLDQMCVYKFKLSTREVVNKLMDKNTFVQEGEKLIFNLGN